MADNSFNRRKEEINQFNNILAELQFIGPRPKVNPVQVPDGLMVKCPNCDSSILSEEYVREFFVCPNCGFHARLKAKKRLIQIMDPGYELLYQGMEEKFMDFPKYKEKLTDAKEKCKIDESVLCAKGTINGIHAMVAAMDSFFMMGSMGSVCGEKITLLCEEALREHLPVIIFCCSGGARMQEGIISLFQMAKTSQAIERLKEQELYISVLTDPTTGGVSASFASLGDITLAEPRALIGFAGRRVIENTIKETLPQDFQTAEFLLEKGYIDAIVERKDMKKRLSYLLKLHGYR